MVFFPSRPSDLVVCRLAFVLAQRYRTQFLCVSSGNRQSACEYMLPHFLRLRFLVLRPLVIAAPLVKWIAKLEGVEPTLKRPEQLS